MENAIDRTSYRRSCVKDNFTSKKKIKFIKIFYNQIIASMSVLIAILFIKFFDLNTTYEWIKEQIDEGISYEVISQNVIKLYEKIKDVFLKENILETETTQNLLDKSKLEVNINDILIMDEANQEDENIDDNYDKSLSEEAKYIKENYNIVMPVVGTITSRFGARVDDNPIVSSYHTGLDIGANTGTKIISALDGTVTEAGTISGYGKCVMIQKDNLLFVYAHCSKLNVKKGQTVKQGDKIGEVGMTGNATGPHLHFEIRCDDKYVNPEEIL